MYIKEINDRINLPNNIFEKYNMKKIAYFDIETTGFDKEKDTIILISLGSFQAEGYFNIKQYFAEVKEDEIEILYSFGTDLLKFDTWCSYNGLAFDQPFINHRMIKNNINFKCPEEHIDLFRLIKPFYKLLGMQRCNLKTVEKHIGVQRVDKIDGAMSVELYSEYLSKKDEDIKDILMLHNYEDVLNLPKIFMILDEVENNSELKREDSITEKQLIYLRSLISKNNIALEISIDKISRKTASKLIEYFLNGYKNKTEIRNILNSN